MRTSLLLRCVLPLLLPAVACPATPAPDPVALFVSQLSLERYKATIKALTQFGDRREGTARNRAANDWIEQQLRAYGCSDVQRMVYEYAPPPARARSAAPARNPVLASGEVRRGPGGSRYRGVVQPTGVNEDPLAQTDERLRELNREPSVPGRREQLYCTKVGATRPDEMYIVGGHMDGIGWGEAANDNASGAALVLEVARLLNQPGVVTDRSVRFILWNNEETGLDGARAYVEQRAGLQGKEMPAGSGRYPEPRWLGMIQHDMMLYDHGMRLPDGGSPNRQRAEADVNIEYQSDSRFAEQSRALAFAFRDANEAYATDYPAAVGHHMTNTDSVPFMHHAPAISLRENERGMHIGAGWNPHWHQPSDRFDTFSDEDFRLGLNALQTTLGAVGRLAGAHLWKPASPPRTSP
ncbi:MAG: hypothetical protein RL026_1657 [Pseudomonadota bacterium]|jgi:hypothetical protein